MNNFIKGTGASNGIAIAKAYIFEHTKLAIEKRKVENIDSEIDFFKNKISETIDQIKKIREKTLARMGEEKAAIFDAHIQMLSDPTIIDSIIDYINVEKCNADYAAKIKFEETKKIFLEFEDPYFKERASDIDDILNRLLHNIQNCPLSDLSLINSEVIIVANDLTPSETAMLDKKYVKGFLTNIGGKTSHAAIMARTLEIPAILGLGNITTLVKRDDLIAIDGTKGIIEINPVDINYWNNRIIKYNELQKNLKEYLKKDTFTKDGHRIIVESNIGNHKDVEKIDAYGSEGVGLLRSEFLYMENDHWPTENEQFESYKYILEHQKNKLVIVRTLDIGGDKTLKYFKFDDELNPFLGYRAIRFCLDHIDIFKTQIRALLRASAYGELGIMFPMISTVDEFKQAKQVVLDCMDELRRDSIPFDSNTKIGMMMEIPAAAILADQFSKYADFFSIGTNDLIQYSFAADRMSEKVKYLYQPNNPTILRLINNIITSAHKNNIFAGMCGEMAGDYMSIPLLLGLGETGIDALSMSASSIPLAKYIISQINQKDCIKLVNQALTLSTEKEINNLVQEFLNKNNIIID